MQQKSRQSEICTSGTCRRKRRASGTCRVCWLRTLNLRKHEGHCAQLSLLFLLLLMLMPALQNLRAELRTVSKQLHGLDERLQFMEQQLGRKRSWLPLFGQG